jgi:diphthine-ammonia ligase
MVDDGFEVIVSGIFAFPLSADWLGKKLDNEMISKLVELQRKYSISPSGEGGEIETTVLNAPFFKQKIRIIDSRKQTDKNSGVFIIKKAELEKK